MGSKDSFQQLSGRITLDLNDCSRQEGEGCDLVRCELSEMDAGVWGNLQHHISLQTIYEKLHDWDLFRLRVVCKDWNRVSLQRLEPKPYFATITAGFEYQYLHGILTYDVASEKFSFKCLPFSLRHVKPRHPPFEVEGLIFCHHPDKLNEQGVSNIHTKTWHVIPAPPNISKYRSASGMVVDRTKGPYTFKLVMGSIDQKTQIYDSKSWSWRTTSSRMIKFAKASLKLCPNHNCMCNNGYIYISLIRKKLILVYAIEGDIWTTLDGPRDIDEDRNALWVWEGQIFTAKETARTEMLQCGS